MIQPFSISIPRFWVAFLFATLLFGFGPAVGAGPTAPIMAWGIKPTELAVPYVNELRHGCHGDPLVCVERYKPIAGINAVAIAFAQPETAQQNIEKAKEFSALSERNPTLTEIGVDDTVAFMKALKTDHKDTYLERLIDAAKSVNPRLQFGVTIYEDEISAIKRDSATFPRTAREKVDRVAFYLHYRMNYDEYREYVNEVRGLFPNARVYGGVYHYDRIDYLRCSQALPGKCSKDQEIGLYAKLLQVQLSMLKEKKLSGLELYPGFLGNEQSWPAWSKARMCNESRRTDCIENSRDMTRETLRLLKQP